MVVWEGNSKLKIERAGEMAQRLGALAALAEDPGSILSTHVGVHNHP